MLLFRPVVTAKNAVCNYNLFAVNIETIDTDMRLQGGGLQLVEQLGILGGSAGIAVYSFAATKSFLLE